MNGLGKKKKQFTEIPIGALFIDWTAIQILI
jgi:hypothetical protein